MDLWSRRKFFFTTLTGSALASASGLFENPSEPLPARPCLRRNPPHAAGDHLFGERR
jgi:hypothetical protein